MYLYVYFFNPNLLQCEIEYTLETTLKHMKYDYIK